MLAIGYWLLAIGYWLLAAGYWLLAALAPERAGAPIVMASVLDTCYLTLVSCHCPFLHGHIFIGRPRGLPLQCPGPGIADGALGTCRLLIVTCYLTPPRIASKNPCTTAFVPS